MTGRTHSKGMRFAGILNVNATSRMRDVDGSESDTGLQAQHIERASFGGWCAFDCC